MQRMSINLYEHIVPDINHYLSNFYALTRASRASCVLFMKSAFYCPQLLKNNMQQI